MMYTSKLATTTTIKMVLGMYDNILEERDNEIFFKQKGFYDLPLIVHDEDFFAEVSLKPLADPLGKTMELSLSLKNVTGILILRSDFEFECSDSFLVSIWECNIDLLNITDTRTINYNREVIMRRHTIQNIIK